MDVQKPNSRFPFLPNTRLVWALNLSVAALDAVGLKAQHMSLAPKPVLASAVTLAIPAITALIYSYLRPRPAIAAFAHVFAAAWAFTIVSPILMYIVVTLNRPLIDPGLFAADSALGFKWLETYQWVLAHPMVYKALAIVYATIVPQIIFLIFTLNLIGRTGRCWEMQWLFMLSTMVCILFLALWPASGAFGHFNIHYNDSYVHTFFELREGTLKVIGAQPMEGLISFPSLHAALAIIFVYSVRGIRRLFAPLFLLNIFMIVSTIVIGGHYLVDLLGGVALSLGMIMIVRAMARSGLIPDAAEEPLT